MLHKTRGIVFRFTRYGETSIIVSIFTELFGLQSYIVNGVRSKSARNKIALYQPLTLLNLVAYHRPNANLERIKEVQCYYPYQTLLTDVRKSTMAMFLAELINKTVKDESHASEVFGFLSESFIAIDQLESGFENAHLIFMIRLSRFLGFGPQFTNEVLGARMTDEDTESILKRLLTANYDTSLTMNQQQRRNILELLLKFYEDHIDTLGEIKSVAVLREVLS